MNFEEALVTELSTITGLSGKIFPQKAVENAEPPFLVYISSEGEKVMTLSGPTDLTELTCEIHIVAESYEQLKTLTKAVLGRIKSFFQRALGGGGPYIKSVSHTEPVEDLDNNLNYHQCSFDVRVRF